MREKERGRKDMREKERGRKDMRNGEEGSYSHSHDEKMRTRGLKKGTVI